MIKHVQSVSETRENSEPTAELFRSRHNIQCYKLKRFVEHPHRFGMNFGVGKRKLCHRQNYKKYEQFSM